MINKDGADVTLRALLGTNPTLSAGAFVDTVPPPAPIAIAAHVRLDEHQARRSLRQLAGEYEAMAESSATPRLKMHDPGQGIPTLRRAPSQAVGDSSP